MTSKTKLVEKLEKKRKELNLSKGEFAKQELEVSKQKYLSWQNGGGMNDKEKIELLEYLIDK